MDKLGSRQSPRYDHLRPTGSLVRSCARELTGPPLIRLHCHPMRLLGKILCVMLSLSVVLTPLSHAHAHVSGGHDHEHVNVHSGHSHDAVQSLGDSHDHDHDHDHDEHSSQADKHSDAGKVVDLQPDMSQTTSQLFKSMQWIAILLVVALVVFQLQPLQLIPRPPRIRTRPPSPYPFAIPLLRGPPVSI